MVLGAIGVALLFFGLEAFAAGQRQDLLTWQDKAKQLVETEEFNRRNRQNRTIKKLRKVNVQFAALLKKAETYWPQKEGEILTFSRASLALPGGARWIEQKVGPVRDLTYKPIPVAKGGEGSEPKDSGGGQASDKQVVKYKEHEFLFRMRGDFRQWLQLLMAFDKQKVFYRLRNFNIKGAAASRLTTRAVQLDSEFSLAAYHLVGIEEVKEDQE